MAKEPKKGLFSFGKKTEDAPVSESEPKKSGGFFSKFRKKEAAEETSAPPTEKKKRFFDRFRKKDQGEAEVGEAGDSVDTDQGSAEHAAPQEAQPEPISAQPEPVLSRPAPMEGVAEETAKPESAGALTSEVPAPVAAPEPVVTPEPVAAPEPVAEPVAPVSPPAEEAKDVSPVAEAPVPVETDVEEGVSEEPVSEAEEDGDEAEPEKKSRFGKLFNRKKKEASEGEEEDGDAPKKRSWLEKLKSGLKDTRASIAGGINKLFLATRQIDDDLLDELEELLIGADIGVQTTMDIIEKIRLEVSRKTLKDSEQLKEHLKTELRAILDNLPDRRFNLNHQPTIMLVIGVNGVGKTTTIGKLARLWQLQGKKVTVCAADTFRAAAVDQLQVWADRTGVDIVRKPESSDPAAVVFDALERMKETGSDVLLVDTAGRLHNNPNLMNELDKIRRIITRNFEDAPHHTLLILDAVTGQNGLLQAKQFADKIGITDLIVTKLDGTAKGGIAVAIAKELGLPIQYIGVGEQMDDLIEFEKDAFVDSLFEG